MPLIWAKAAPDAIFSGAGSAARLESLAPCGQAARATEFLRQLLVLLQFGQDV